MGAVFVDSSTKTPCEGEFVFALLFSRATKPVVEVHSVSRLIGTGRVLSEEGSVDATGT